jgi:hypothetical protein
MPAGTIGRMSCLDAFDQSEPYILGMICGERGLSLIQTRRVGARVIFSYINSISSCKNNTISKNQALLILNQSAIGNG